MRLRAHCSDSNEGSRQAPAPALSYFDAATFEEARDAAILAYVAAGHCLRCRRVLLQRFERLGSTLFRDDDPRELTRCFKPADRDGCTVRLLAACIVLFARDREDL